MPQAGSPNSLADFAAQLVCDQRPMADAEARRIIVDAGFDPAGHPPGMAMPAHGAGPASGVTDLLAHLFPTSLPMVLGHLLAALVLGWLLRCGEAAVWRAVELSVQSACQLAETAFVRTLGAALALMCIPAPAQPLRLPRRRMRGRDERPARELSAQALRDQAGPAALRPRGLTTRRTSTAVGRALVPLPHARVNPPSILLPVECFP
ncbi:hypothetical protein GCM10020000_39360 [Streptomyces olivoverticillatus]